MFKVVYLPTAQIIEYPDDFKSWYKPYSPYAEDIARRFLEANEAYQDFGNPDKLFFITYDDLIARFDIPGKKIPKHLLEVIEVT